jgi:hypothetical protein
MVHAVSRAIWGIELFSGLLRSKLTEEMIKFETWYTARLSKLDYDEALEQVRR